MNHKLIIGLILLVFVSITLLGLFGAGILNSSAFSKKAVWENAPTEINQTGTDRG